MKTEEGVRSKERSVCICDIMAPMPSMEEWGRRGRKRGVKVVRRWGGEAQLRASGASKTWKEKSLSLNCPMGTFVKWQREHVPHCKLDHRMSRFLRRALPISRTRKLCIFRGGHVTAITSAWVTAVWKRLILPAIRAHLPVPELLFPSQRNFVQNVSAGWFHSRWLDARPNWHRVLEVVEYRIDMFRPILCTLWDKTEQNQGLGL